MKQIGLLGGTSWPSTIEYYRLLNQLAAERLGGFHSARLLLQNIDYHDIKSSYGIFEKVPALLKAEIMQLVNAGAQSLIICNNTLHKAFDVIEAELHLTIPVFHAVRLTAQAAVKQGRHKVLLLATKFTMEDNFFRLALTAQGVDVVIPTETERAEVQAIQSALAAGNMKPEFADYFTTLIVRYAALDAVILACTELPLAITSASSALPILNPLELQCVAAIDWAMGGALG